MGALVQILTTPGALADLRWQWLIDSPAGPADFEDISALTADFAPVASLESSLDESLSSLGVVLLHARVPTPPGWAGAQNSPRLGGLALFGPAGELLQIVWINPPVRSEVRAVTITLQAMTGS